MIVRAYLAFVATAVLACQASGNLGGSSFDAGGTGRGGAAGHAGGGAAGSAGTGGHETGGSGGASVPGPDVSGRWAMFAFEDPVAVDLHAIDGAIAGDGCCGGLGPQTPSFCCGAVNGQIVGRHVTFGFTFNFGPEVTYWTDAFVSADGQRMAGRFNAVSPVDQPIAWVRIEPADAWLPRPDPAVTAVLTTRSARYALVLSDDPPAGNDFSAQQTYRLAVSDRFVYGDLGSFWDREMSWSAGEQTLIVGPVPETAPGLPVALSLRFDGTMLTSVEAALPSGTRYHFQAAASQP